MLASSFVSPEGQAFLADGPGRQQFSVAEWRGSTGHRWLYVVGPGPRGTGAFGGAPGVLEGWQVHGSDLHSPIQKGTASFEQSSFVSGENSEFS